MGGEDRVDQMRGGGGREGGWRPRGGKARGIGGQGREGRTGVERLSQLRAEEKKPARYRRNC